MPRNSQDCNHYFFSGQGGFFSQYNPLTQLEEVKKRQSLLKEQFEATQDPQRKAIIQQLFNEASINIASLEEVIRPQASASAGTAPAKKDMEL